MPALPSGRYWSGTTLGPHCHYVPASVTYAISFGSSLPLVRLTRRGTGRRSEIMSTFRGLRSSDGNHGAPGPSLLTHPGLPSTPAHVRLCGENVRAAGEQHDRIIVGIAPRHDATSVEPCRNVSSDGQRRERRNDLALPKADESGSLILGGPVPGGSRLLSTQESMEGA